MRRVDRDKCQVCEFKFECEYQCLEKEECNMFEEEDEREEFYREWASYITENGGSLFF